VGQRPKNEQLASQGPLVQRQQVGFSRAAVAQRIVHNGATIDIATLDLADARPHLARIRRVQGLMKSNKPVPADDSAYTYATTGAAELQTRIKSLEVTELASRYSALKDSLVHELAALATSADWDMNRPAWVGTSRPLKDDKETLGGNVTSTLDAVRDQWLAFLGPGSFSHKHPRTGAIDPTRLVSADGQRSIRYGNHERNSAPNQHHFHQETWTHHPDSNTVSIDNLLRRVSVS
jgi:hypothetical protein